MTRHITDHRGTSAGEGLKQFRAAAQRLAEEGQHPAVLQVLRRPTAATGGKRLAEYTRIERGRLT